MYCKNCGKVLNQGEKFCVNCGTKLENESINNNTNIYQNNIYNLLNTFSFINATIMVFYTFSKEAGNLGVLAAFMVGPLLMASQTILIVMSFFKKKKFILNFIFILGGLISTILTLNMFNYNFNIFIILNIILLITMFINLLISDNKFRVKK